jgi:hypothetical protein
MKTYVAEISGEALIVFRAEGDALQVAASIFRSESGERVGSAGEAGTRTNALSSGGPSRETETPAT